MTTPADVLDYLDESFYLDFRAQGHGVMIQFVWIYEHDVSLDGLRRFHRNLEKTLLNRCIEPSPIPFARSRWIAWHPPADFEVAETPRARSEITDWVDEQAALPIDIENGPPWRLAVQPLLGGGAAVTLVAAHAVADGVGMANSVADAVNGVGLELGYPEPHSRKKSLAMREDLRQVLRDLPRVAKALVATPRTAKALPLRLRPGPRSAGVVRRKQVGGTLVLSAEDAQLVRLPWVTAFVDTAQWDQRAAALGGTGNSLLIGLTVRLCEKLNWLDSDGLANVTIPVNERQPHDTRGNALTGVAMTLNPSTAGDLPSIRAQSKSVLSALDGVRKHVREPLPLMPFVPTRLANRFQGVLLRSANITCSNSGDLNPATNRPDGTDAEWFTARHARDADMATRGFLQRAGGIFFPVASGRLGGRVYVNVCYCAADSSTTTEELTELVRAALDDFGLTADAILG